MQVPIKVLDTLKRPVRLFQLTYQAVESGMKGFLPQRSSSGILLRLAIGESATYGGIWKGIL